MRVIVTYYGRGKAGSFENAHVVRLVDGRAVFDSAEWGEMMQGFGVLDDHGRRVFPEEGERYLHWLALAFPGSSYVTAELVEDDGDGGPKG